MLKYFDGRFAADGYRLPDLLRTVALSKAFSTVKDDASVPTRTAALTGAEMAAPNAHKEVAR